MDLKKFIRSIPDYPKKGILFRDITTLIKDEKAFEEQLIKLWKDQKNLILTRLQLLSLEVLFLPQQFHIF